MRIGRGEQDEEPALNLTSMIDVVFLLIIFFMVATTFTNLEKELDLKLPEASTGRPEEAEADEIVINVMSDGRMKVGDEYYDVDGLTERLKRAALANAEIPVMIRGDRDTAHQNTVNAMEACGRANLKKISIGLLGER